MDRCWYSMICSELRRNFPLVFSDGTIIFMQRSKGPFRHISVMSGASRSQMKKNNINPAENG